MIRVAVVDDNETFLKQEESILKRCLTEKGMEYEIKVYSTPGNLVWDLEEQTYFDIFLIDIEMPGINGLELAQKIRLKHLQPYLVFITSHMEYSVEGYEYNAYRYILKENMEEKLPPALEIMLEDLKTRVQRQYIIEASSKIVKINYENILYFQVKGKYTYFHTSDDVIRERITLKNAYQKLAAEEFIYIEKSNVVNLHHIMRLEGQAVIMRNGERLPVSIPQLREVRQAISSYWSKS